MSTIVQLALAVGDRVSLGEASALTALARESGVAAIRLADTPHTLDPTVTASHLAGVHSGIGFVAEVPTTHHAPYNTARRVSSLDRATGGRAGIALLAGDGDEVSDATAPDPAAADPARRWSEYAGVLTRLWESFPSQALIGDQEAALVVREELIRPVGHDGVYYRVAGPLDGPSSAQGRPVVVADLGVLDPAAVAESADVVVVEHAAGADDALTEALRAVGRDRREVTLLGRVPVGSPADVLAWVHEHRLDGVELVPAGGAAEVVAVLRAWATEAAPPPTLRAALGLRAEVAA
ncbi:LLM class flavin-dependent oxidoreductase [Amycolatopsis thermoflava]